MATGRVTDILQYLRGMFQTPTADQTDRQLLERFVASRDELAFGALVQRHAPLVWRTCRGVLGNDHDAEDAFQATFFVLTRKARSVIWQDVIAGWLYKTSRKIAIKAKTTAERKRRRSREYEVLQATNY